MVVEKPKLEADGLYSRNAERDRLQHFAITLGRVQYGGMNAHFEDLRKKKIAEAKERGDRGDGEGVRCGDYEGHPKFLRALRIPASGPTFVTTAVGLTPAGADDVAATAL